MNSFKHLWKLDPDSVFLNHGSFGACPTKVLEKQTELRNLLENQPVRFMIRMMEEFQQNSKTVLAKMIHCEPEDMVFVTNATAAVNAVFRSIRFKPDDEILFTNHIYGACKKVLDYIAFETGCKLVEATVPFPVNSEEEILAAILSKISSNTRIALIDHISSPTALIFPVEQIVNELNAKGIEVMVDGAHALGSLELDLKIINADYYTSNCHKWLCGPKTSAILHIRKNRQEKVYPLVISHAGYNAEPFTEKFYWPGTIDPTPIICAGFAAGFLESVVAGGWEQIMEKNHKLVVEARGMISDALNLPLPCPDNMLASMATFILPPEHSQKGLFYRGISPLQEKLYNDFKIEVPVWYWGNEKTQLLRISAQLYNDLSDYRKLATALKQIL